jgi:hypothetical protein
VVRPSKRVLTLFADAEKVAAYLLELKAEEGRLQKMLERVWRTRSVAMGALAARAKDASQAEEIEWRKRKR